MSRIAIPLLIALAGCQSAVHELEPGEGFPEGKALVAGRFEFRGTRIQPSLRLRSEYGRDYRIALGDETFLVALPAGFYTVYDFGGYRPSADTLTIEAPPEGVSYIGTFQPTRDSDGDLCFRVVEQREPVKRVLDARYGDALPEFATRTVISSLDPLDRKRDGLVVAVQQSRPRTTTTFSVGFGTTFVRSSHASTSRSRSTTTYRSGSYSRARTRVSASSTRYSTRPSRSR